jgi:CheY-like chemotaxis protein
MNVLIIEDNAGFQEILVRLFGSMRKVYATDKIEEAIIYAQAEEPDLIVLDINLTDSRGMATVERIPELMKSEKTALVILSGYADAELKARAIALGASGVVEKGPELKTFEDITCRIRNTLTPNEAKFANQICKLEHLLGEKL